MQKLIGNTPALIFAVCVGSLEERLHSKVIRKGVGGQVGPQIEEEVRQKEGLGTAWEDQLDPGTWEVVDTCCLRAGAPGIWVLKLALRATLGSGIIPI